MTSLAGPLALNADVLLIPVAELPEESRGQIDCSPGDVAVSRLQGRSGSKIVDADAARLLERFREPRSIVEAVILYAREKQVEPDQVLEDAFPMLRSLVDGGFLSAAGGERSTTAAGARAGSALLGGTVVRALQVLDDTEVHVLARDERRSVVKLERVAGSPIRARLAHEAAFLDHLAGTIAPRLLERGEHEGRAAIEIELVAGADAAAAALEWRERPGRSGREGLLALLRGVAGAYAALHERGVLHGDVHPRNALVEADGRVRLVDFGLASGLPGTALPAAAERGGVPFFYEPELARASLGGATAAASPAGEQHAVAALLYQLATGAHWQDFRLSRLEMLEDIATKEPLAFRARGVSPWPELEPVLARGLAKDPAERHASLRALADALDRVTVGAETRPNPAPSALPRVVDEALAAAGLDGPWLREGLSPAPTCSVNYGEAGVAAALLQVALRREDARVLALADVWARRAERGMEREGAFHNADIQITPDVVGESSPYHSPSGVHAVAALVARARADGRAQAGAVARFLQAASRTAVGLDLTLGRSSTLVGAALLLDATPDAWPEAAALRAFGDRAQHAIWTELDAKPAIPEADVDYPGLAHGWAGFAYAALQWCRVSGAAVPAGLPRRLDELARLARPAGRGLEWPWMLRGGAESSTMAGWCNGTCGHLFLWALAAEVLPDRRWLELAVGAGWNTWEAGGGGVTLCCGLAGRAYALLALHRVTGDAAWLDRARLLGERAAAPGQPPGDYPHALFKGALGVAVLAADLERPAQAALPLFEPARYRG
ncbi:MAG: lanthionine synthetase LanC family protein [Vicinamibacteria bacterium]